MPKFTASQSLGSIIVPSANVGKLDWIEIPLDYLAFHDDGGVPCMTQCEAKIAKTCEDEASKQWRSCVRNPHRWHMNADVTPLTTPPRKNAPDYQQKVGKYCESYAYNGIKEYCKSRETKDCRQMCYPPPA